MVETQDIEKQVRIIIGPIVALLRSRKFMMPILGLFVTWLVTQVPTLAPYTAELILGLWVVIAVIVGGIAHEDAAATKASAIEAAAKTQAENLQSAIEAGIAAFYDKQSMAVVEAQSAQVEIDVASLTKHVAALVTANLVEQGNAPPADPAAG